MVKGTHENPLFRANDIAEILNIGNIRICIAGFNDTEKVILTIDIIYYTPW